MLFSLCRFSYKLFYQFINKKSKQSANRIQDQVIYIKTSDLEHKLQYFHDKT